MKHYYYNDECEEIIEEIKAFPRKEQYSEGPGEFPPLIDVIGYDDYGEPYFFSDYISVIREIYPEVELTISEGNSDFCYTAARAGGKPEIWIEACHKHNVKSDDYSNLFIEFNCAGAYNAALYMLKNAEYFQLNNTHIAKAFYYLIAETELAFHDSNQPKELIDNYIIKIAGKINLDIFQLTGVKDSECKYLFFKCLDTKPFSAPLLINQWMDKKILEDRNSWKHFAKYYSVRNKNFHLSTFASIKMSEIKFDDSFMIAELEKYNLTTLIEAYKNASEQC